MWQAQQSTLEGNTAMQVRLRSGGVALSYADVIDHWRVESSFRSFFIDLLASAPFAAYFWETPPVSRATLARRFEFVLTETALLDALPPQPASFRHHFESTGDEVVGFYNLGGDAYLIAPRPRGDASRFVHLGRYSRLAPLDQQHLLWQKIGCTMTKRLSAQPLWLSTCGTGVGWLHVRLDQRPKYYVHRPYRTLG